MNDTPSKQIDNIIKQYGGWKGDAIQQIRAIVHAAYPDIVEEIKWKTASRPEGLPAWTHNGLVCFIETWKDNVKLIFFKGTRLTDSNKLFNSRLKSGTVRAIELRENTPLDTAGIKALVRDAIELNTTKAG